MDYNLEDLQWRCQECDASAPPTSSEYMKLLKHQKGHHIHLVNTKTSEILATTVKQARSMGIDIPGDGISPGKTLGKALEKPSGKTEGTTEPGMEISEEGITFLITLPPVVFTLFDAAKAAKLVDEDKDLDSWLFECVQTKFKLDYGLSLMLIPVGEKK